MDSDSDSDVSSHASPSSDHVPAVPLLRCSYTVGWVPADVVQLHAGAALLNGVFETPQQRPVMVFVPTEPFWQMARSQPTQKILEAANFWRFFKLKPWGPDYRRAWEFQCSLKRSSQATVTGFDGHPIQFTVTKQMIRQALHTTGMALPEGNFATHEKQLVMSQDRLTFANLRHKEVSLALQLYMQFFGMAHTQKYTMPELRMAWHFTKAFIDPDAIETNWSDHIIQAIHRIQEGSRLSGTSVAKKNLPLFLGAPLVLTRIAYYAMGAIHHLPPPLLYDATIPYQVRTNLLRSTKRKDPHQEEESEEEQEEEFPLKKKM